MIQGPSECRLDSRARPSVSSRVGSVVSPTASSRVHYATQDGPRIVICTAGAVALRTAGGAEVALTAFRGRLIIELAVYLDRRISRRVFAHLLRVRIDGAAVNPGRSR